MKNVPDRYKEALRLSGGYVILPDAKGGYVAIALNMGLRIRAETQGEARDRLVEAILTQEQAA